MECYVFSKRCFENLVCIISFLVTTLWSGNYYLHFTDEEYETERFSNWPKNTQPVSIGAGTVR